MMKNLTILQITPEERDALTKLVRGKNTAQKVVLRAKIVLLYSEGQRQDNILKINWFAVKKDVSTPV